MSVFQFFTARCCRNAWTKNGRILRMIGNGRKRLRQFSDITTLIKTKINSDMLAQRLLDKEQQMLFKVQRARALNLDSDEYAELNISVDSDVFDTRESMYRFEKKFHGWKAITDLDKKLLLGVVQNIPDLTRDSASRQVTFATRENIMGGPDE